MMMMKARLLTLALLSTVPATGLASQVLWGSARLATNYLSSGAPETLGDDFTFQLGAFEAGFVPTAANTEEWLDHWTPAQSTQYNGHTHFFTGSFVYQQNESPFLPSNQGYIFGFNRWASSEGSDHAEWILATDPSWQWPSGGAISPPVQWSMSNASTVILGSIGDASDSYHMQTARIPTPVASLDGALWAKRYNRAPGDPSSSPDSDQDGLSDDLEFFLSTNPLEPDQGRHPTTNVIREDGVPYMELAFFKLGLLPGTSIGVEVSPDLENWSGDDEAFEVIENSLLVYRARSVAPMTDNSGRYYRLKVYVTP